MIVVNLFAGPGAGKSTTAAGIFHHLKMAGINCEIVTEYAKDLTWEERHGTLKNQVYVFGKQVQRLHRLVGKVDLVVTDSPILLPLMYCPPEYPKSFAPFVKEVWDQFENRSYFLDRVKVYNPAGRNQTETEARKIDRDVISLLEGEGVDYTRVTGDYGAVAKILEDLAERL